MKRSRAALTALVAAVLVAGSDAGANVEASNDAELTASLVAQLHGEVVELSFSDAVELGYSDIYPSTDLEICESAPDFQGYDSEEAAAAAAAQAKECAADPTHVSFVIGAPEPTSNHGLWGYHHNGQQSYSDYQGGWVRITREDGARSRSRTLQACPTPAPELNSLSTGSS